MNRECPMTSDVVAAFRLGGAPPSMESHLANCESCRTVAEAGGWMRELAVVAAREQRPLPDPRRLWASAELQRQNKLRPKRLHVMDAIQWTVCGIAAIGPATWFALRWPEVIRWISSIRGGEAAWMAAGSSPILWTAVALGGITTLVTLQMVFADE